MDTSEKTKLFMEWLDEKSIDNIKQINLYDIAVDMDSFIIGTALNERHARSIADFIHEKCGENNISILGIEGAEQGRWILMDFSDVILHIFVKEERERYALEKLWSEGKMLTYSPNASKKDEKS